MDVQLWWLNADLIQNYVRAGIEAAGFTTGLFATETAGEERILRNAFALRHGLGMLTETMWADPPLHRVDMQLRAPREVLRFHGERRDDVATMVADAAQRKAAAGADRSEPFYLAGTIDTPPPAAAVLDPPPCGYLLHTAQADLIDRHQRLFPVVTERVSEEGVFVTMAQPMMTVVPLLLDGRASFNEVEGLALDDCSDPGSVDPPPPPPPTPPGQHVTGFTDDQPGQPPSDWSTMWRNSAWTVLDDPVRLRHTASGERLDQAEPTGGSGRAGVPGGLVSGYGGPHVGEPGGEGG